MSQQDAHGDSGRTGIPSSTAQASMITDASPLQRVPLRFDGTARGYFGVWIVNILLTIVTLGLWSAWGKVRTLRWFYGHTTLDGHGFDYHATGEQILKGRLIALAIIGGTSIASIVWPVTEPVFLLFMLAAMPWAINAGLRFNACMTSWSNVRFGFRGHYGRALYVFLLLPLISLFTAGLLIPFMTLRTVRYLADGYRYGDARFASTPRLGTLYAAWGRSLALFVAVCLLFALAFVLIGLLAGPQPAPSALQAIDESYLADGQPIPAGMKEFLDALPALVLTLYTALFISGLYYSACARNETFNQCTLQGGHRLQSRVSPLRYVWIIVSGLIASVCTVALAYPWARVRHYRYLAQSTTLLAVPGLDQIRSQPSSVPGAFGGEFSQLEGFSSVAPF